MERFAGVAGEVWGYSALEGRLSRVKMCGRNSFQRYFLKGFRVPEGEVGSPGSIPYFEETLCLVVDEGEGLLG